MAGIILQALEGGEDTAQGHHGYRLGAFGQVSKRRVSGRHAACGCGRHGAPGMRASGRARCITPDFTRLTRLYHTALSVVAMALEVCVMAAGLNGLTFLRSIFHSLVSCSECEFQKLCHIVWLSLEVAHAAAATAAERCGPMWRAVTAPVRAMARAVARGAGSSGRSGGSGGSVPRRGGPQSEAAGLG